MQQQRYRLVVTAAAVLLAVLCFNEQVDVYAICSFEITSVDPHATLLQPSYIVVRHNADCAGLAGEISFRFEPHNNPDGAGGWILGSKFLMKDLPMEYQGQTAFSSSKNHEYFGDVSLAQGGAGSDLFSFTPRRWGIAEITIEFTVGGDVYTSISPRNIVVIGCEIDARHFGLVGSVLSLTVTHSPACADVRHGAVVTLQANNTGPNLVNGAIVYTHLEDPPNVLPVVKRASQTIGSSLPLTYNFDFDPDSHWGVIRIPLDLAATSADTHFSIVYEVQNIGDRLNIMRAADTIALHCDANNDPECIVGECDPELNPACTVVGTPVCFGLDCGDDESVIYGCGSATCDALLIVGVLFVLLAALAFLAAIILRRGRKPAQKAAPLVTMETTATEPPPTGKKWNVKGSRYIGFGRGNHKVNWGEKAPPSAPEGHNAYDRWNGERLDARIKTLARAQMLATAGGANDGASSEDSTSVSAGVAHVSWWQRAFPCLEAQIQESRTRALSAGAYDNVSSPIASKTPPKLPPKDRMPAKTAPPLPAKAPPAVPTKTPPALPAKSDPALPAKTPPPLPAK